MEKIIRKYFEQVKEAFALGNTETAYNAPIMNLLANFECQPVDTSGARARNIGENIDLKLWRIGEIASETEPFAGVEVKKIGGDDDRAKAQRLTETKQFGNIIWTDNHRWEFWHLDEHKEPKMYTGIKLIDVDVKTRSLTLVEENISLFISLVQDFMLQSPKQIKSSGKLAEYMAIHARTIRDVISGILGSNEQGLPLINDERQRTRPMFGELYGLYNKIKTELSSELKTADFADMYAQTIVYGLFIARYNDSTPENFSRNEALGLLQQESALLKQFFIHITTSQNQHPTLIAVIDKLCELYKLCDLVELLDKEESKDTIVHFYEDFLSAYDPALRKSLGVFYTPQPVVRYMVSMVDQLLIDEFGITGGLSNSDTFTIEVPSEEYASSKRKNATLKNTKEITVPKVAILDPATGTGTFHAEIIKFVKEKYFSGARAAFYESYIENPEGLMSRLIGFEIMMTSYVVAHLKIRRTIDETLGHTSKKQLPSNIYLTNTLAPTHTDRERAEEINLFMDFSGAISDEAYHADTWKNRRPIKVVIGNPPYLAASTNPFDISGYRLETDGLTPLKEKRQQLNDDYVKFFRFSEQIINQNSEGVLAFISNNNYLDSPTNRGMRASLLRTFDKIYIINLHGNSIKKEVTPEGGKDENIFDIMQGVSIFIGLKSSDSEEWATVNYADIFGTRNSKFDTLNNNLLRFEEIKLNQQTAAFCINDEKKQKEYEKGLAISDLFHIFNSGIETQRDALAIQTTKLGIKKIIQDFQFEEEDKIRQIYSLKDSRDWTVADSKKDLLTNKGTFQKILYRPFDNRWTYFTGKSKGFIAYPRNEIMKHFLDGNNYGFVFTRKSMMNAPFANIFISNRILDKGLTGTVDKAYVAPLYLYNELSNDWTPNFNEKILSELTKNLSTTPPAIDLFDYCYGVLYDPTYREKYNEFLKRDYPRVPIIADEATFEKYVTVGSRLRKLHLMQTDSQVELTLEPNDAENITIEAIKYKDGVLNINKNKQILGISEAVWNYRIGGYQVLDKWFKSHKGEVFDIEKYEHICKVVGVLAETIEVQEGMIG
ncbi:type ISP restriction/modification enzyme [Lactococcus lactis]|uniref:site-specific DNA-methyltransferase (adenine-specific) n=1 Tax=Lactococcus lactis TaxID=1358 RepID=A0AAP3Z2U4_9LACT|nr:type ISP restriction/modification enzyme [Lactococcus lactis]MDG4977307.1 N-6 DNA methylase [Lactococcus lactis]